MTRSTWVPGTVLVSAGMVLVAMLAGCGRRDVAPSAAAQAPTNGRATQPLDIPSEVAHLKERPCGVARDDGCRVSLDESRSPRGSADWRLAEFYFDESRQHIQWTTGSGQSAKMPTERTLI